MVYLSVGLRRVTKGGFMKTKTGVNRCNCCKSDTIQEETERYISDLDQYVFYRSCTRCSNTRLRYYNFVLEWTIPGRPPKEERYGRRKT